MLALVRLHGRNHGTWNIKGAKSAAARMMNFNVTSSLNWCAASLPRCLLLAESSVFTL